MSETPATALVTGTSRGIGRAIAKHLLGHGWKVVGCSRSPETKAIDHPNYVHEVADIVDEKQVRGLVRRAAKVTGTLDAVINNAAVASMNHSLLTPARSLDSMLSVNVTGTFLVAREAAKAMRKQERGRIVNISSVAVPLRLAGQSAYVASKASVERLSQVLAREFAEYGVTVNVIGATPIDTDMTRGVPKETMDKLLDQLPIRRLGTHEDLINVLDFLLRPESDAISGQIIYLGGVPNG